MAYNPYENYLETQVFSASPLELVTMLYRAAIESLETARCHAASGDFLNRANSVTRALNILIELTQSINHDQGGDVARNLVRLYDYIIRRVQEGNAQNDDAAFQEAIQLLTPVLEAWQSIDAPQHSSYLQQQEEHQPIHCSF